jgi:CRP-like cAMP-binding protein
MRVRGIRESEVSQMSATQQPSTETTPDDKEGRLLSYLRERAADGELYFKSKFIADEVDLSPKEIGALMVKLRDSATDLEIEKWSYTSATTWRVEAI